MASKKKETPELEWRLRSDGGEYAKYKMGIIFRYKKIIWYKTAYNLYYKAKDLADAKRKIDRYTLRRARAWDAVLKKK